MTFKFSLEPVLKVNEHREKQQQQKYAAQVQQMQSIKDKISSLRNQVNREDTSEPGYQLNSIHAFRARYGVLEQMHVEIGKLEKELTLVDERVEVERRKLVEAHRKTHMMETMKSKEKKTFTYQVGQIEQGQMDEVAAQIVNRR
ncbi:MAG: flagellar export protein FliJ [Bacteroidetes bacterium]|nr:flagellar export protein FliJ [Bacteroidota bacterium]MCH8523831.1 flagellar export protein FliJ [Balneolales bacterium]